MKTPYQYRRFAPTAFAAVIIMALGASNPAHALPDDPALALLPVNFAAPGARAAGMGGSYIGLSDDSSTVFLNPAGLPRLASPEITVELRYRAPKANAYPGFPAEANVRDSSPSGLGVSFASVAFPRLMGDRLAGGLYYGQLSDFRVSANSDSFASATVPFPPIQSEVRLEDTYAGLGVGFRLTDRINAGLSLYQARRKLRLVSDYDTPDGFYAVRSDLNDSAMGVVAGLHARPTNSVQVGVSWRSRLDFVESSGTVITRDSEIALTELAGSTIPEALTLGASVALGAQWIVALDLSHIRYSQLTRKFPTEVPPVSIVNARNDLRGSDAWEPRLGLEYTIPTDTALWQVRAGAYQRADGSLRYKGDDVPAQLTFPGDKNRTHLTVGLGVSFARSSIEVAVDHGSGGSELVAAYVFSLR